MRTYKLSLSSWYLKALLVFIFSCLTIAILIGLSTADQNYNSMPVYFICTLFIIIIVFQTRRLLLHPRIIQYNDNGDITFKSFIKIINISDKEITYIHVIEEILRIHSTDEFYKFIRFSGLSGIRIEYRLGEIFIVGYIQSTDCYVFLADLLARNPDIEIHNQYLLDKMQGIISHQSPSR